MYKSGKKLILADWILILSVIVILMFKRILNMELEGNFGTLPDFYAPWCYRSVFQYLCLQTLTLAVTVHIYKAESLYLVCIFLVSVIFTAMQPWPCDPQMTCPHHKFTNTSCFLTNTSCFLFRRDSVNSPSKFLCFMTISCHRPLYLNVFGTSKEFILAVLKVIICALARVLPHEP